MTETELDNIFGSFKSEAFRLEVMPYYRVSEEAKELALFLAGDLLPHNCHGFKEWTAFVRKNVQNNKKHLRLRILPDSYITPYILFELETGYPFNEEAGEEIRFLSKSDSDINNFYDQDYWLFDKTTAVAMLYEADGTFKGAEVAPNKVSQIIQFHNLYTKGVSLGEILSKVRNGTLPIRSE